jgi:type IV secretion system protein VirB9
MRHCVILLATTFITPMAHSAMAADPKPCADDPRVQCMDYRPNDVVRLYAAAGATLRIELAPGEEVEGLLVSDQRTLGHEEDAQLSAQDIAAGAQSGSKAVPTCDPNLCRSVIGNFVYLMPRRELVAQPLFLQGRWTDAAGKSHSTAYAFELQTRPPQLAAGQKLASNGAQVTDAAPSATFYGVRFSYPQRDDENRRLAAAAKAAAWRAAHPPQPRVQPPTPSAPQLTANWKYAYRGAPELKPDEVWDDGRTTFLRFNGNRRVPNVYAFLPDGTETNGFGYTVEPETTGAILRIGKTDRRWCVRDGDRAGCIYNFGSDPAGRTVPTVAAQ